MLAPPPKASGFVIRICDNADDNTRDTRAGSKRRDSQEACPQAIGLDTDLNQGTLQPKAVRCL
ncbi:MAG: hypothetical protein ACRBCJ_05995 [Hyphomicrobiaceae bacterium]